MESKPIVFFADKVPSMSLPDVTGIYYFMDRYEKPIYIGKAKNIRKRILTHDYTNGGVLFKHGKSVKLIKWELTGNITIASLLEDHRIRSYWPELNRAQKSKPLKFAVEYYRDMQERWRISLSTKKSYRINGIHFHRYEDAYDYVAGRVRNYQLNGIFCNVPINHETQIEKHQIQFQKMLADDRSQQLFDVFYDKGRSENERSYILTSNGIFQGFGFIGSNECRDPHKIKKNLVDCLSSPVTEKIIRKLYEKIGPEFSFTGIELSDVTQKMKALPEQRKGNLCIPFD